MANDCARIVQACALRVTRLNSNGTIDAGADGSYVTDALTQLVVTPVITEGDEFETKNACGAVCVNVKDCDRLKRLDLTLGLCYPDPELMEILVGGTVLTDGTATGYAFPAIGEQTCPNGVGLEIWAKRYDSTGAVNNNYPYEWFVFPRTYWQHGARTHENGPLTIELTGFATENDNWVDGPANDFPVASDKVLQSIPTTDLPDIQCGYVTVTSTG